MRFVRILYDRCGKRINHADTTILAKYVKKCINFAFFFHENFRKNSNFCSNFQKKFFFKYSKNKKFQKIKKSILTNNLRRFLADNLEKHLLTLLKVLTRILQHFQYFSCLFKDAEIIFIGANLGFFRCVYACGFGFFRCGKSQP
jgi:hypothetical protein